MTQRIIASTKTVLFAATVLAGGSLLPATAQQSARPGGTMPMNDAYAVPTAQDDLKTAATVLNTQRAELFGKHDSRGAAEMYMPNATYVELLPRLDLMQGREEIQKHFQDLMSAHATEIVATVTSARMNGDGSASIGGDYSINVEGGKKINGHFFQVLQRYGQGWKIAQHIFARPEPITPVEISKYNTSQN